MRRGEAVVAFLGSATQPAEATVSNGPVVVIVLAIVALAGTALTAMGPTFVEIAKNRGSRSQTPGPTAPGGPISTPEPSPPASNQMVQSAQNGLSLVEAAVLDYRAQRDNAMRRYDEAMDDLAAAQEVIREQAVYIAQLEAQMGRRRSTNYGVRHAPRPDIDPQNRDHL